MTGFINGNCNTLTGFLTLLLPVFLLAGCTEAYIQEDNGAQRYSDPAFIAAIIQAAEPVVERRVPGGERV
jgi:hypothetical protein